MKISHIIAIVIVAVAIGIIVSTSGNASKYVAFKEAYQMAAEGNDDKVHVVGKLKKDGDILFMKYNPKEDANLFSFVLVDVNKEEHHVIYYHPKPQDFEKSEQVVIIGSVKDNVFIANEILMKCPSKYENQEIKAAL